MPESSRGCDARPWPSLGLLLAEVAGFRVGAPPRAQFDAWSYFRKYYSAAIRPKTYVEFARRPI
jgi:hypothetical protein